MKSKTGGDLEQTDREREREREGVSIPMMPIPAILMLPKEA